MKKRIFKYLALTGLLMVFFTSGGAWAKMKTFNGSIQGANCVAIGTVCPVDASDAFVALEREFVLLVKKGEYYFMPNLERSVKVKYLGKPVRIKGDLTGKTLLVSEIATKSGGSYKTVWSWEQIMRNLNEGGRN